MSLSDKLILEDNRYTSDLDYAVIEPGKLNIFIGDPREVDKYAILERSRVEYEALVVNPFHAEEEVNNFLERVKGKEQAFVITDRIGALHWVPNDIGIDSIWLLWRNGKELKCTKLFKTKYMFEQLDFSTIGEVLDNMDLEMVKSQIIAEGLD